MSDRTEALLTQLVELQHRQIALLDTQIQNQRAALEGQNTSLDVQRDGIARYRRTVRFASVAMAVIMAVIILPYAYQWFRYLTSTP
jgi:hypothetical protein